MTYNEAGEATDDINKGNFLIHKMTTATIASTLTCSKNNANKTTFNCTILPSPLSTSSSATNQVVVTTSLLLPNRDFPTFVMFDLKKSLKRKLLNQIAPAPLHKKQPFFSKSMLPSRSPRSNKAFKSNQNHHTKKISN